MIDEFRIYYESLEQAENYIKPLVENALLRINKKIGVKLIRLKGNYLYYSRNIAPIIFWKDPDILITTIKEGIEYPLLLIEFSNAVFTEDHELQRFDGMVASSDNDCVYLKISPLSKKSRNEHGGNVDFDYIGPFALIYNKLGKLFYHFDWECDKNGSVIVDENYLSCPKSIDKLDYFIEKLIEVALKSKLGSGHFVSGVEMALNRDKLFHEWKNKVATFKISELKGLKSSRTEWIESSKELRLKLNRFGHAMDPERGMLTFYGVMYPKTVSKMLFDDENSAWYKDTPNELRISNYIKSNGLHSGYDFLHVLALGSGLDVYEDFKKIESLFMKNVDDYLEIDLSDFLRRNYNSLNKALRTIFKYSVSFVIVDKNNKSRLRFNWSIERHDNNYKNLPKVTKIKERKSFEEDDITYIMVHSVLKQNDYKIIAVSYPGAQSDRVILIAPGTGRRQERRYVDIISYLPSKYTTLQENKGQYSIAAVQSDIDEISKYKDAKDHIKGLNNFIDHFDKNAPKAIRVGVGFWASSKFNIDAIKSLDIRNLDYFVYITSDRKEWIIWNTGKDEMFKIKKGAIKLTKTFEPYTEKLSKNQMRLSKT